MTPSTAPTGDQHRSGIQARLAEIAGPHPSETERLLLARLLTSYVRKTPPAIDHLARALHAADTASVRDQAHTLKGSAANIGVTAMSELFAMMEDDARDGRLPEPLPVLTRIRDTFERVAPVCTRMAEEVTRIPSR